VILFYIVESFRCVATDDVIDQYNTFLKKNVRVLRMDAAEARGPCWARHIATSLWCAEKYFMQIDSHIRFRPCWDTYLIHLHNICKQINSNCTEPVLSTYPIDYVPDDTNYSIPTDNRPTLLV
jgi:[Skp1-protein]-hydroxyproline N-acetylglucosaminyltransferase